MSDWFERVRFVLARDGSVSITVDDDTALMLLNPIQRYVHDTDFGTATDTAHVERLEMRGEATLTLSGEVVEAPSGAEAIRRGNLAGAPQVIRDALPYELVMIVLNGLGGYEVGRAQDKFAAAMILLCANLLVWWFYHCLDEPQESP